MLGRHPADPPLRSSSPSARAEAVSRYVGFSVPGFPPDPDRLVTLEKATGVQATAVSLYMSLGQKLASARLITAFVTGPSCRRDRLR